MFIRRVFLPFYLAAGLLHTAAFASDPGSIPGIEGESILLVRRPEPEFQLITGGGALAGSAAALGPLHDFSAGGTGKALLESDHIADPASALSANLLANLVETYKLRSLNPNGVLIRDDKALDTLVQQRPADLVFEFYTEAWRTWYFLADFNHLDIWYYAQARLIDARTGATLRHAKCVHTPEKTAHHGNGR